ncbi:uncharacterized protein LOC143159865 [Aptenodytes patagonicus]|uniref:uncharacterized protein LOC143159865 n=1 Tax=Aptenodytes patagonicus TaxID=9234 RepID=UPI003F9ED759
MAVAEARRALRILYRDGSIDLTLSLGKNGNVPVELAVPFLPACVRPLRWAAALGMAVCNQRSRIRVRVPGELLRDLMVLKQTVTLLLRGMSLWALVIASGDNDPPSSVYRSNRSQNISSPGS